MKIDPIVNSNVRLKANGNTIRLCGQIDQVNPGEFLDPFFEKVLKEMGDNLVIDFSELDFMNSNGIKSIVTFIMSRKKGTKVNLQVDPGRIWQKTSLKVVASLDPELISVTEVGQVNQVN